MKKEKTDKKAKMASYILCINYLKYNLQLCKSHYNQYITSYELRLEKKTTKHTAVDCNTTKLQ